MAILFSYKTAQMYRQFMNSLKTMIKKYDKINIFRSTRESRVDKYGRRQSIAKINQDADSKMFLFDYMTTKINKHIMFITLYVHVA